MIICIFSEEIFSCERTFERIILGALFGNSAPHFIAGWKSDFKDQVNIKFSHILCVVQLMVLGLGRKYTGDGVLPAARNECEIVIASSKCFGRFGAVNTVPLNNKI